MCLSVGFGGKEVKQPAYFGVVVVVVAVVVAIVVVV
jgi:hypothetical protein